MHANGFPTEQPNQDSSGSKDQVPKKYIIYLPNLTSTSPDPTDIPMIQQSPANSGEAAKPANKIWSSRVVKPVVCLNS